MKAKEEVLLAQRYYWDKRYKKLLKARGEYFATGERRKEIDLKLEECKAYLFEIDNDLFKLNNE